MVLGSNVTERGFVRDGSAERSGPSNSLPCLYSNNCIETALEKAGFLDAYRKKTAFILAENIAALVDAYGLEKIGFLTLTFPTKLTLKEANKRFHSFSTNFLHRIFPLAWLAVREWSPSGHLHFHLLGACAEDIRTGFGFGNYLEMSRISKRRGPKAEIRRLGRSLSPNPALKALWGELRAACPKYQFGRHELIPIRKSGRAVAYYVGGYIQKTLIFRPFSAKGARLITYSQGFPRRVNSHQFMWLTENTASWRRKVGIFAALHGVKDLAGLAERFGPRWSFWFRDLIETLNDGTLFDLRDLPRDRLIEFSALLVRPGPEISSPLHSLPPRAPMKDDGKLWEIPPPLRSVFIWHLKNWRSDREKIYKERNVVL